MTKIHLTSRALDDIQEIYDYSLDEWGEQTALKYIQTFEDAFSLLQEHKGLLKVNEKISSRFRVYAVQKHFLICDIIEDNIFVLTVKHVSMNLLEHLKELESGLDEEAKALHKRIKRQ
ncbi:MAG: type II toxin-antitoxin system RelE/ParE family toxin [Leadbetterella sp.]|nr:type II toxin-antitoxin system RelE/ParE family toxin [Leadbetterella sp.]